MHAHNAMHGQHGSPAHTEAASDRVVTERPKKGHKGKRGLAFLLAFINALLFALLLSLCAWFFNKWANGDAVTNFIVSPANAAGTALTFTIIMSFISGAVGLASAIMGMIHSGSYTESARHSALSSNLISFGLVCLAFGFAVKALTQGHKGPTVVEVAITIAAVDCVLVLTTFLYLLSLGLFKNKDEHTYAHSDYTHDRYAQPTHGNAYNTTGTGGLPTHHTTGQPKYAAGHVEPTTTTGTTRAVHA